MADNRAIFVVDIITKGLKNARDSVANVGKGARDAANAYTGADKASKDFYNTQAKGVIGTANSTKSFSKLAETMNNSSGIVGAYATLAANIFAVTAAFNALRGAAQVQQVQAGLEAMGNRMGTTLSIAAENVREISKGTLTVEQSLRSVAQIASGGFGTQSMERLASVANDVSVALGRNMTDSMDRLTRGVIKLEPELLDELGLMTKLGESTSKYANQLGKSETQLSSFEKRQGFMNAILAEGEAKFGGLADEAGNTRNLDLLGATFSDLTTEIFTFINKGALPLAALLSNKGVLLGGMLLFASTISKQLLPGLTNLQIKAAQTAITLKEVAKAQVGSALTDLSSKTEPRAVKGLRRAIENDSAQISHYEKALAGIAQEEQKLSKEIDAGASKRKKYRTFSINQLREEHQIITDQGQAIRNTMVLEKQAAAQTTAANSIAAAGQKKLLVSYYLLKTAVVEYSIAVNSAAVATGKLGLMSKTINGLKVAFFAAATGVKAFTAAAISMMGTIGILVTVVWALVEGFKWLKEWWQGDDTKNFNKAIEEQDEVLGQLGKRYDEMVRVRDSLIPIAQREQMVYKVMTNTIRENIEAYEKVKEAQDKVFKNKGTVELGQTREFETLKKLRDFGGPEVRKQIELVLGKEGLTGILEKAGKQINKGDLEKLSKIISVDLRQGAVTLGDHISDLATAFTEADMALAEFNRSAIISTPYDTAAKQIDSVATALTNISVNAGNSDDYMLRLAHTIVGAGENLKKFLNPDTQGLIKEFNELDLKMKEMEKSGQAISANDRIRKTQLTQMLAIRSSELYTVQAMFADAQHLTRVTDNQIKLEQVRLDKLNKFTALTGSSIRQRREAENKIIQLQATQLKAQQRIVETQMAMTKIEIQTNQILLDRNEIYQSLIVSATKLGSASAENFLAVANQRLIQLNQDKSPLRAKENAEEIKKLTTVITQYQTIRGLNQKIKDLQDQQKSIATDITAALAKQTSQSVINAEANATNASTLAGNTEKAVELATMRNKLEKSTTDIIVKQQGRIKGTAEEYNEMVKEQQALSTIQKTAIANSSNAAIQNLRLEQAKAEGNQAEIKAYDIRIGQEQQLAGLKMQEIDRQNQLNILDKFSFDIHKAGLDMQRDSFVYLEKVLDAQGEYVDLQREGGIIQAEIARKRKGVAANEFTSRMDAINEARDQLRLAQDQAGMRKAVIRLEFALLEAQRQQMVWNLQAQRQILGANTEQGRQLAIVIGNLQQGAGAIADAQRLATEAVDQNINNLAKKLESAGLGDRGANLIGGAARDYIKLRQMQTQAVKEAQEAQAAPITEALETHVSPLVQSTNNLQVAVIDSVEVTRLLIQELQKARNAPIPATEAIGKTLSDFAKIAQQGGFRVSEINAQSGHRGAGHREGRAFDMNIGTGNIEANNPAMRARMDAIAQKFVEQGLVVLWNGQRMSSAGNRALTGGEGAHRDHMHVEIPRSGLKTVGTAVGEAITIPIVDAVQPPMVAVTEAAVATEQAANSIKAANDNPAPAGSNQGVPRDFETLANLFTQFTSMGDFNMLQVFEEMADKLGPEGTIVSQIIAGINNVGNAIVNFQTVMANSESSFADKFVAGAAVVQSAISTISGVLQAASDARVAGIDREIAAEQKRDGKSAESVAKIQALERKKDAIQRKAFNINKKLMMAQAVIATAAGIAQALTLGPIVGPIMAAVIGALGAAQIAIIAGTSYQSTAGANFDQKSMPSTLTIGKRGDGVDVSRHNPNIGGEISYLRGSQGTGNNSSNYMPYGSLGSAYGGPLPRGYGHSAFVVGEKGPEILERDTPINVRPINDNENSRPLTVNMNVSAWDGQSVHDMLTDRRGDLIDMFREAANANGSRFMEEVNTAHYKKANGGKGATRI